MLKEKEELEKLRSMTEEERREYERRNPKEQTQKVKKKWKFMQKYYHKGAFFQVRPSCNSRILLHFASFVLIHFAKGENPNTSAGWSRKREYSHQAIGKDVRRMVVL